MPVHDMVARHAIDATRIYLLGFSQGASVALALALTVPGQIAGVVALSVRFPREVVPTLAPAERIAGSAMFLAHGIHDDIVPIGRARATREFLCGLGVDLVYREYVSGHQIAPQALSDAAAWLSAECEDRPKRTHGSHG